MSEGSRLVNFESVCRLLSKNRRCDQSNVVCHCLTGLITLNGQMMDGFLYCAVVSPLLILSLKAADGDDEVEMHCFNDASQVFEHSIQKRG